MKTKYTIEFWLKKERIAFFLTKKNWSNFQNNDNHLKNKVVTIMKIKHDTTNPGHPSKVATTNNVNMALTTLS